ncbi:MAG: sigma-70 family RNA polymerase sigma factor [Terriglobia bacterium]
MDADIVELARKGDPEAWERIVSSHTKRVFNLCYRFLGRADQAEDMTQEIFLKVFRNLGSYRPESGQFFTWMVSVGRNLLIDHYRQSKDDRVTFSMEEEEGTTLLDTIPSPRISVQGELEMEERALILKRALDALPPQLREAVVLRDLEELSYEEIGDILKVPEGTVKSRINRARIELTKHVLKLKSRSKGASPSVQEH